MRKIILYTASSLDDYIARSNGAIDWLEQPEVIPEGEDFGYQEFYNSVDTTLMGNNTYRQVIGFGGTFPYIDKENFVFSRREQSEKSPYISYINEDIGDFCRNLKSAAGKNIWLIGGGRLNTELLDAGLIDRLIITKIPVPIGTGIPVFYDQEWKSRFSTVSTKVYGKGVVQLTMDHRQ